MTSDLNSEKVPSAWLASRTSVIGPCICLVVLCSCATTPNWNADDSIRPPLPGETSLNEGAGRGDQIRVMLHLKSGRVIPVMVDTGSPDTILDKSLNPKLGKRLGTKQHKVLGMKQVTSTTYKSPELYLGGTQLLIGRRVSTINRNGDAAILGIDCLQHYCIQLDFAAGKLRFLDRDLLKTEELGQAFPITISPWTRHVHVREDFMGAKGAKWMIDTGCNIDAVLQRSIFQQALRAPHISTPQGEINGAEGLGAWFPEAQFRGQTYTNLMIGEMPRNASFPNLIGLQFLARHLVTFNFPKRIMYLKRASVGTLKAWFQEHVPGLPARELQEPDTPSR